MLVRKPESKRPLVIRMRTSEDNIRMDFREIRLDSSGSGNRPVVGSCDHGNEPSSPIQEEFFLTS
jgi:hypothetical protein